MPWIKENLGPLMTSGTEAVAQDSRLPVFRLLVGAGLDGMPAGHIPASLRMPPSALTFHLDRLRDAGLVNRDGRMMI
jgi:ArsR family transcriptional regulator, arsenate/arsenite/antimonite-responsive transcriptional repressor